MNVMLQKETALNLVEFTLNGRVVTARPDESILEVAKRQKIEIPYLCYMEGMRPAGNCRACMVEIKGERVLAPSCCRYPKAGMEVSSDSARAVHSQKMILELLKSDMPEHAYKLDSELDHWVGKLAISQPASSLACRPGPTCRTPPWRSTWTPASSAHAACEPAARSRSTT